MTTSPDQATAPDALDILSGLTVTPGWIKAYDSAEYIFPAGASHVFKYGDGDFKYSRVKPGAPPLDDLYQFVHSITVMAGTDAAEMQLCDYERFNRDYYQQGADRNWNEARAEANERSIWYCDRADLRKLFDAIGSILWTHHLTAFWIPTLDNVQWTPDALLADIRANWKVDMRLDQLWGNQYLNDGPTDTSNIYLRW